MSEPPQDQSPRLAWLADSCDFPKTDLAWANGSGAPGLLAAGDRLDAEILQTAYSRGIFPWFTEGEPVLWWSPDPRMVLRVDNFRCHRSLRQAARQFEASAAVLRLDHDFESVMRACAAPRPDQAGTWISDEMVAAYLSLHRLGLAHSLSLWQSGEMIGGLYCVSLGKMVFGESMFSRQANASKVCLAGLVGLVGSQGASLIDCQQQTRHLASLGAAAIPRAEFESQLRPLVCSPPLDWDPQAVDWHLIHRTHGQPARPTP